MAGPPARPSLAAVFRDVMLETIAPLSDDRVIMLPVLFPAGRSDHPGDRGDATDLTDFYRPAEFG